ncbi:hypothetical protein [Hymenobacter terricola]|uniref:hypothetical protein n=1 Tax=Hymenobacter terricola TaxID=2819236 RepID=UPI001B30A09C|nr:hypothetical protein [Hymenobacter terricola]
MPEWLLLLLCSLANLALSILLLRGAYDRGYSAGIDDSLEISRHVDDILRK